MLLDGFDLKIQNIPYFDQSVAYVVFEPKQSAGSGAAEDKHVRRKEEGRE